MLREISHRLAEGNNLVLVHGNADPDALGSAYAIASNFPETVIGAPGGLDRVSKVIRSNLGIDILEDFSIGSYSTVVIVDTSSPDQLASSAELPDDCIVIDHHARSDRWKGHLYYCDDSKASCAEIVYELLRVNEIQLSKEVGLALLVGMLTDSGHFHYARPSTLSTFAEIMEATGIDMDRVMSLTRLEVGMSEKVSVLKGAQRIKFERIGRYIVATSHGSAYESSVCKSLLTLGADVAFVASQRGDEFRLSARANQDLVRQGLHLGRMLEDVGGETLNDGGGHGGAAGLVGMGDVEAILHICMQRSMDLFRELKRLAD